MKYRPEIDGLRALAVIPVILFHANFPVVTGGFVGVDVFFVISGYLITTIIAQELEDGRFSISEFYARRARRILPALFLVLVVCVPLAVVTMMPNQLFEFGRSLIAVLLFASNIQLWREGGYFEADSEIKPLLHTWSLAVEEQFYVLFPILLILLWRFGRGVVFWILLAIAAGSLVVAEALRWASVPVSFYLTPFRAWELLAGSLCALVLLNRPQKGNSWLAALGLLMILVAIDKFHKWTPMPSAYGLLPVAGAALIILFATRETLVGKLLSLRPIVMIGLISYSAYLWHQPLFAFARLSSFEEPSPQAFLGLSIASLLLGWLTWRFVELPFRRKGGLTFRHARAAIVGGLAGTVGLAVTGVLMMSMNGFPQRFPAEARQQFAAGEWSSRCLFQISDGPVRFPTEGCSFGEGSRTVAIIGDSVAASIAPALIDRFRDQDVQVLQLTHGMCLPATRTIPTTHIAGACADYIRRASLYLEEVGVDLIITAALWSDFGASTTYDGASIREMTEEQRNLVAADISETLGRFGVPVLLVMPYPRASVRILDAVGRYFARNRAILAEYFVEMDDFQTSSEVTFDVLNRVRLPNLTKVYAHTAMCRDERCYFVDDSRLLLSDAMHFTRYGSERVLDLPAFRQWFEDHEFVKGGSGS
ncbi:acyltransferase [Cereibacter changlensis JA139]|uniref:Acyltransferase n=2 Tax=Cereibacter changlensis TaxID=402884 RepID=A0A2T4JPA8_9RHOB|nr:acyltransferase family protein [Cereibacter changlensis]PTE19725.1 acyltransferase [Cereibacter changlensis JA139]PZX48628.1 peptidoglycan/LPS O-acetylase OafA/YrhL [Cereibacter changlensis]